MEVRLSRRGAQTLALEALSVDGSGREFGGIASQRCRVSVIHLIRLVEAVGVELTQDALAKAARGDGQRHVQTAMDAFEKGDPARERSSAVLVHVLSLFPLCGCDLHRPLQCGGVEQWLAELREGVRATAGGQGYPRRWLWLDTYHPGGIRSRRLQLVGRRWIVGEVLF